VLEVGGEEGVVAFLRQLAAETDVTLALIGATSVSELDESWISASS
jgi:isopentenyl diphosphate isomerase/L-lactate dehydrogenase-like FMN-dependent dehydrogenase